MLEQWGFDETVVGMSILGQRGVGRAKVSRRTVSDPCAENQFVTSDGTTLYVRTSGPEDAPLTVLFVHGWTQDNTCWDPIIAGVPADVRVVRHDHRGHGSSAPARDGTRTLERIADDLAELIPAVVPEGPIVLVGHSMGGMTVMALAQRHPELVAERVAGAAFVATSSSEMGRITLGLPGFAGSGMSRIVPLLQRLLERRRKDRLPGTPRILSIGARRLVFGKKANRTDVLDVCGQVLRSHPASIGGFIEAMGNHDRTVALGSLRDTHTVVLVGDRDRLCPVEHAKVIADSLQDTEYLLFPGAGHMLMYERPVELIAALNALIAKVAVAAR